VTTTRAIVIATAVRPETRAILAALEAPARVDAGRIACWEARIGTQPFLIQQVGVGPTRAAGALRTLTMPYRLVVSAGFAGALVAGARPGDLVLPAAVVSDAGRYAVPSELRATVESALSPAERARALTGALHSSPVVVDTPAAKRALAARHGAVAVDMESAALAEVAVAHGAAALALRVVLDPLDLSLAGLPPDLDSSWTARLRLLGRPAAWPGMIAVARHLGVATAALTRAFTSALPALANPR